MRKKFLAIIFAALFALATVAPVLAHGATPQSVPQSNHAGGGLHGYEGQPGNQGGPQHNP